MAVDFLMFKELLYEKYKRKLQQKEMKAKQDEDDAKERIEIEAKSECNKVTMQNFQTEYQKLYIEKDILKKKLEQLKSIMEIQYNLQRPLNQAFSLKHPNTYIGER